MWDGEPNAEQTKLLEDTKDWRKKVLETKPSEASGLKLCSEISLSLDKLIQRIYNLSFQRALKIAGEHYYPGRTSFAVIATGSYGRMQLCPFSDVDIIFVPSEQDNPFIDVALKQAFRLLISTIGDATGMRLGYAYRPLEDIPNLDSVTKTSLMDARVIAGDERLYQELIDMLFETMDVMGFVHDKVAERIGFKDKLLHLTEPNIKHGVGMLRDIQQAIWLLSAIHKIRPPITPTKLYQHGLLTLDEAKWLEEALDFFLRVRNWLHLRLQKREETLLREYHDEISVDFGFTEDGKPSIEGFFKHLCWYAEFVNSLARQVERMALEYRIAIDEHFHAEGMRLYMSDPEALLREPQLILKAFEYMQRYDLELSHMLRDAIRHSVSKLGEAIPQIKQCGRKLMSILDHPSPQRTIREMVELGVLQMCIPELGKAMSFVPSNRAHELTVGAHCVRTMLNLADLEQLGKNSETLIGEVWRDITERSILHLAALLHDLGKLHSEDEHEHCEAGAAIADRVAKRFELDADKGKLLTELVRNHMMLLKAVRLHDIHDEVLLAQLTDKIKDAGLLRMLYLLSYADAQAVSKQTFTTLERELLDSLFINLNRYIYGHAEVELDITESERWRHLSRRLRRYGLTPQQIEFALSSFPTGYLLNTPTEKIAEHLRMIDSLINLGKPVITIRSEPGLDFSELLVCTHDEPGLLSKICGALYAQDVDIRAAQALTVNISIPSGQDDVVAVTQLKNIVLDTLFIRTRYGQVSEAKAKRLQEILEAVLLGNVVIEKLLEEAGLESTFPIIIHSISVSNAISKACTVIRIKANDRKGLLFRIAGAISSLGLDIVTAKIATWRDVAEDSFYVVTRDGIKVPDEKLDELKERLRERLEMP